MWTCPKCQRIFPHKIPKEHSCMQTSLDSHFDNRAPVVRKIFDKIKKETKKIGKIKIEPIKGSVIFKKTGTFLSLSFRKDHLKAEFFLKEEYDGFPIEKTMRYTKSKIVHTVSVSSPKEVDKQLMNWIKESYELAK